MRFDGSDVSSLGAIAFGTALGLVATGAMMARLDASRDAPATRTIEVQAVPTDWTTAELLTARSRLQLRARVRTTVDMKNGPVIFIDGVRVGTTGDLGVVVDDFDPEAIASIEVRKGPDDLRPGEIHIELKR
jgi:TonB-dependent Receptor Plug Domain